MSMHHSQNAACLTQSLNEYHDCCMTHAPERPPIRISAIRMAFPCLRAFADAAPAPVPSFVQLHWSPLHVVLVDQPLISWRYSCRLLPSPPAWLQEASSHPPLLSILHSAVGNFYGRCCRVRLCQQTPALSAAAVTMNTYVCYQYWVVAANMAGLCGLQKQCDLQLAALGLQAANFLVTQKPATAVVTGLAH